MARSGNESARLIGMIRSYLVTPSLWVGDIPVAGGIRCETVDAAVQVILSGENAVLPHTSWATAQDVLRALGVDDATVERRLYFAQTATFMP